MERVIRPEAVVLPESALVPDRNRLDPPPNRFTHEVTAAQPYYYDDPGPGAAPAGEFPAGTRVVLLAHHGGRLARVADARGLYVLTPAAGLRAV